MTIALSAKVNDGLVLAADSETTMELQTASGQNSVQNFYDNANKVFNLHKELPVGLITWGLGNIGFSSVSTLVKDFRKQIAFPGIIDINIYTVQDLAGKFFDFIYTQKYQSAFPANTNTPAMGFIIGGYSSGSDLPETWSIQIREDGTCTGPVLTQKTTDTGAIWAGQPEAITRLVMGRSPFLESVLKSAGMPDDKVNDIIQLCDQNLQAQMFQPAMPIQDAIDVAEFLINTTIKYVKYVPGHQGVGGPVEIAAITKHEGFKWVKRKYYFSEQLNPKE